MRGFYYRDLKGYDYTEEKITQLIRLRVSLKQMRRFAASSVI